ncbi:unnamed protein product, partial [Ectocarpus fasciculatus]
MEHDASHVALESGEDLQDASPAGGGTKKGEQRGAVDVAQATATQPAHTPGAAAGPADETASPLPREGSNSTSPKTSEMDSTPPEGAIAEQSHEKTSETETGQSDKTSDANREIRRRKTMELMSQGGLHLKDILADPSNDSTPVEAMRSIMVRGKEHGWTTSQLFGVFLETGSTEEKIPFDHFQRGLRILGLTIPEEDEREIFKTFDTDGSGTIELSEFIRWCLDIDTMAWKAERVRRTTGGQTSGEHGKCGDGEIGIDEAAARMAGEVAQAQLPPEQPRYPLGNLIYEGSKLFWRTGESLRIAMHENKEKHCVAISTMLEGESDPFPVLKVDSRLIRVNGKDAVLERIAEMTE